jgi:hypothetical protein
MQLASTQPSLLSWNPFVLPPTHRALSSVSSMSVLRFSNITQSFGNFTRPADWTKFVNRVKHYGDLWCCLDTHPPVVHYSLLWDVAHTDMFNRQWNGTWVPLLGP